MKKWLAKLLRRKRVGGKPKSSLADAAIMATKDPFWQARTDGDSDMRTLERLLANLIESATVSDTGDKAEQVDRARTLYIDVRSDKWKDLREMVQQGYTFALFDDLLQSAVSIVPDDGSDEYFEYFYAASLLRDHWQTESRTEETRKRFVKPGTETLDIERLSAYFDEQVEQNRAFVKALARTEYKNRLLL